MNRPLENSGISSGSLKLKLMMVQFMGLNIPNRLWLWRMPFWRAPDTLDCLGFFNVHQHCTYCTQESIFRLQRNATAAVGIKSAPFASAAKHNC